MANIDPPVQSVSPARSDIIELTEKSVQASASLRNKMRYLASRVAHFTEFHRIAHFAGNLDHLKVAYANSDAEAKPILLRQFDAIVNQLTMRNGVTKETFANRLENDLLAVLSRFSCPTPKSAFWTCRLRPASPVSEAWPNCRRDIRSYLTSWAISFMQYYTTLSGSAFLMTVKTYSRSDSSMYSSAFIELAFRGVATAS